MKRKFCRCLTAAVLVILYSIPAQAARLLIPVGEVVGLSLSEGTVTVAAFHETLGVPAREAGIQISTEAPPGRRASPSGTRFCPWTVIRWTRRRSFTKR